METVDWELLTICVGAATLSGLVVYHTVAGYYHYRYYVRRRSRPETWKCQPKRFLTPALQRTAVLFQHWQHDPRRRDYRLARVRHRFRHPEHAHLHRCLGVRLDLHDRDDGCAVRHHGLHQLLGTSPVSHEVPVSALPSLSSPLRRDLALRDHGDAPGRGARAAIRVVRAAVHRPLPRRIGGCRIALHPDLQHR